MALQGEAFLALWNDRSPKREDYDVWHTREHVPQRLTVPGITRAVRYSEGQGALPRYFTFYTLDDLSVLSDPAYVHLLKNPTPWSQSMRPDFARFFRLPCRVRRSTGGGAGGYAVAALITAPPADTDLDALVDDLVGYSSITAVHIGETAPEVREVPFSIPFEPAETPAGVLFVEGYENAPLIDGVRGILNAFADRVPTERMTSYNLAFALNASSVPNIHPFPQP